MSLIRCALCVRNVKHEISSQFHPRMDSKSIRLISYPLLIPEDIFISIIPKNHFTFLLSVKKWSTEKHPSANDRQNCVISPGFELFRQYSTSLVPKKVYHLFHSLTNHPASVSPSLDHQTVSSSLIREEGNCKISIFTFQIYLVTILS